MLSSRATVDEAAGEGGSSIGGSGGRFFADGEESGVVNAGGLECTDSELGDVSAVCCVGVVVVLSLISGSVDSCQCQMGRRHGHMLHMPV